MATGKSSTEMAAVDFPRLTDYARYILDDDFADAEREWLHEFARWAKGDSDLTAGEGEFIAALRRHSERVDGGSLTIGEAETVRNLAYRLGYLSASEDGGA